MLLPQRTKFRKQQKGRLTRNSTRGNLVSFGSIGLQAVDRGYISSRQIEAGRRVITRALRRGGKIWIRIFPDKPITLRPAETRMGKGKGSVDHWAAVILPGRVIYEVDGVEEKVAEDALKLAGYKLPLKTQIIKRGAVL
ncbi:MAG: 50S ribosomal protein L16 [SAR324 cluster bacterium]|nr:50S ribosomal protein L16 [SAR324 cluster bacterium]MBF0353177.1 50S ribosomal protein L16 [SAR324 cluster bacterium]